MLRCPPTTIILGRPDLLDYDKRKKGHTASVTDNLHQQIARIAVSAPGEHSLWSGRQANHISKEDRIEDKESLQSSLPDNEETSSVSSTSDSHIAEEQDLLDTFPADFSTENSNRSPNLQSLPMKNEFDYGGFIEYPQAQDANDTRQQPPSFPQEDFSTTQNGQQTNVRRLRHMPLPRSPLFLSQNAASPEGRLTTGLTPRVVSRVATHRSPGIIFAQPPRRPLRPAPRVISRLTVNQSQWDLSTQWQQRTIPRTLRHQSNSFSFDSSEQASAAYEQERAISNPTDDTTVHPAQHIRLHYELQESSPQSSRLSSGAPILLAPQNTTASPKAEGEAEIENRDLIVSSSGLPLPPPFSSVSRRTSNADSLPSSTFNQFTHMSSGQSDAGSPLSGRVEAEDTEANPDVSPVVAITEPKESPPSQGRFGAFISRISRVASYRARPPLHLGAPPSSSPPQIQTRQTPLAIDPETPSRPYRVYNDELSPSTQPQTPANLPESRHQSRYHPSYTAPVVRQSSRQDTTSITATGRIDIRGSVRRRYQPIYTPVRGGSRSGSPSGMREEGFEGLYGGRENGNEEQNWVDGIRFNNVETRLWGERDARNNGEALRVTPEPEDWRIGRRN